MVYTTQPAPLPPTSGTSLYFTSDPVVQAQDAIGVKNTDCIYTATLSETGAGTATYPNIAVAPVAEVATFTGLITTFHATAKTESFAIKAYDTAGGV